VAAVAGAQKQPLETYSLIFPGRDCDERPYIHVVAEHAGLRTNFVEPRIPDAAAYEERMAAGECDFPEPPNVAMSEDLYMLARERGSRVLLGGHGSDQFLAGGPFHYAELLRDFRLGEVQLRLSAEIRSRGALRTGLNFFKYGVAPFAPGFGALQAMRQRQSWRWLGPAMLSRAPSRSETGATAAFARGEGVSALWSAGDKWCLEAMDRSAARFGVEPRYPFYDSRLVEFMIAMPGRQRERDCLTKAALRDAMRGRLPEKVRGRADKAGFTHVMVDVLLSAERIFDGLTTGALGWVDAAAVGEMYRELRATYPSRIGHLWPLWSVLSIELWARTVLSKAAPAEAELAAAF
jgi:asparagine synthase (glutamine-hydrolysing)